MLCSGFGPAVRPWNAPGSSLPTSVLVSRSSQSGNVMGFSAHAQVTAVTLAPMSRFLIVIFIIAFSPKAFAQRTWVVDAARGQGFDYATIQDAVDAATDRDTILVRAGVYSSVLLRKGLHLVGLGRPELVGVFLLPRAMPCVSKGCARHQRRCVALLAGAFRVVTGPRSSKLPTVNRWFR